MENAGPVSPVSKEEATLRARLLGVIGDSKRFFILSLFAQGEEEYMSVSKLGQLFEDAEWSHEMLTGHLRTLWAAGILERHKGGNLVYYSLNQQMLKRALDYLQALIPPNQT